MKTYLLVWFNSEGRKSSEITKRLTGLGFKVTKGAYDYEYDWKRNADLEEIFSLSDKVHETLRGCNAYFKVESQ
ncbi:hypothetical protein HYS54_02270 [Candidatus Micrarchaeota archaeon]|nr:hypothetical protein [Candidatus Micrarchaeota archaeon]